MTQRQGESADNVVFQPLLGESVRPALRPVMSVKRMTDHGDFVEWDDGKQQWRWRLPDQAHSGAAYPIMTTVVIGELPNKSAIGGIGAYAVCFTDATGMILGRLSGVGQLDVNYSIFEATLMPEAWAPLERRGVTVVRDRITSVTEFYRRHPDPTRKRHAILGWLPIRGADARRDAALRTGRVLPAATRT